MLHRTKKAKHLIMDFDFIGLILFSAGMILLLMGLNWGGVSLLCQLLCDKFQSANQLKVLVPMEEWIRSWNPAVGFRHSRHLRAI